MSAEAQKLIEEIRDGYGSGRSAQAKMQQDPSLQAVIGKLTTTLENACRKYVTCPWMLNTMLT